MTNAPCSGIEPRAMDQTVLDLMEAVALQEKALSEVLCAESQKMRAALDLEDLDLGKLLEMNDSAVSLIHAVANLGLLLKDKLELIVNNLPYEGSASGSADGGDPTGWGASPPGNQAAGIGVVFWRPEPVPPYGTGALRCPPAG